MVAVRTARRPSCSARSPSVAFVKSNEAVGTPKRVRIRRLSDRDGRGFCTPPATWAGEATRIDFRDHTAMQVAAVVLHYRGWPGIRHALDALLDGERSPDQLVVVDNCPRCQAAAQIDQAYPMAEVIRAERNLGYAGGMNLGLARVTDADAVLLLTQDCVLDRAALGVMLRELADPGVGAVGPLVGEAASGKSGERADGSHAAELTSMDTAPILPIGPTSLCSIANGRMAFASFSAELWPAGP